MRALVCKNLPEVSDLTKYNQAEDMCAEVEELKNTEKLRSAEGSRIYRKLSVVLSSDPGVTAYVF